MKNHAFPDGAQSKNPEEFFEDLRSSHVSSQRLSTFSSQCSLMRRLAPRGGSVTVKEKMKKNLLAPPCLISFEIQQEEVFQTFLCFIRAG
jgi:hypothetical protein